MIFWSDLLPHDLENITFENKSIDVVISGCFEYFDTTACVRIVKWMAKSSLYQAEFIAAFLKMVQFIFLCHFYWSLVSRILHQQKLINWIIVPLLGLFFMCFSSVTVLGMLSKFPSWLECLSPHWVLLSLVEFLGIQLYVVAGIYITRNINSVAALESFRREQKRDLWSVIATYEFSSFVSLAYYISLQSLGSLEMGCSGIFNHAQNIYSPVYATFMVIKYLLPIWVMVVVFFPDGSYFTDEERPPWWSRDGSTTSMFDPEARYQGSYKQLVEPVQDLTYSDESGLRRSISSPDLSFPAYQSAISEANPILPSARPGYVNYGALEGQPHTSRARSRHDSSRQPPKGVLKRGGRVLPVSLNQCAEEVQSVSPSTSGEIA